eukprot:UN27457
MVKNFINLIFSKVRGFSILLSSFSQLKLHLLTFFIPSTIVIMFCCFLDYFVFRIMYTWVKWYSVTLNELALTIDKNVRFPF